MPADGPRLESADGVLDLDRLLSAAPFDVHAPGGQWDLVGTRVLVDADRVVEVELTFAAGDDVVAAAQAAHGTPQDLPDRVAGGLAYQQWRKELPAHRATAGPAAFLAAQRHAVVRLTDAGDGWRQGVMTGSVLAVAPQLAVRSDGVVLGSVDVTADGLRALGERLVALERRSARTRALQAGYRRRLAQLWWDAPRVPLYLPPGLSRGVG